MLNQIQRYLNRLSGLLLDRIDMYVEVARVEFDELARKKRLKNQAQ